MMDTTDYSDRIVLITGGTGSFGNAICRHLLDRGVRQVRVLSRDEAKQHAMRLSFADSRLKFYVGDVRNLDSLTRSCVGVDAIFHAAALKQVPSCEFFPIEAVQTNILGSANVIQAAELAGVRAVVCLSTDKAVLPLNAMGMTKGLMEKVVQSSARHEGVKTIASTVRYGNVLYSRGSVIPLFVERIFAGRPLPVTNPDMTRFLMPMSEAVGLVEFALYNAAPGDTFVRKAKSATMGDVAKAVNALFGDPVEIEIIGERHGEKLYETLATVDELSRAEETDSFWRVPMDSRDLNYADYFEKGRSHPSRDQDYHSHNAELLNVDELQELLGELPEMQSEIDRWDHAQ